MNDTFEAAGFSLDAPYQPTGDQPLAIEQLSKAFLNGQKDLTLLGVTGSGKTFTMANIIQNVQLPTLVISHNKTLCAQLYSEFRGFFPNNAVEYFVSYYDYYQPEAYVPGKDLYIEKESSVNEEIDKLRLSATRSLLSRRDVIIVASVSSIYGLGSPAVYEDLTVQCQIGQVIERDSLLRELVSIQYSRGDMNFQRGRFRVRGDVVEIWPAYDDTVIRLDFFGDEITDIATVYAISGEILGHHDKMNIYPAKHFVVEENTLDAACEQIEVDLKIRYKELLNQKALLEAQRLKSRTEYDIEMLREVGYCNCSGIENYARYLSGRPPGSRPYCLYDFFPPDFLCFIDESHASIPQIKGMYEGDRSRKQTLVDHGFRLPSALDNRPMMFEEWEEITHQRLFVSATPGPYEAQKESLRAEQLIRPTGLIDPEINVRPTNGQVDDLIKEISTRAAAGERSLITTITKRLSEDLADFLSDAGIKCTYLHSEIDALERIEILHQLRKGDCDCIVGVNLLREGLDLPEVSLVAILDADKQGFLRSETSLIQTMGRAARHLNGLVVMYADVESDAMKAAIRETRRRRASQLAHNKQHGIIPRSAVRRDDSGDFAEYLPKRAAEKSDDLYSVDDLTELKRLMLEAATELEFEKAAYLRDQIKLLETGEEAPQPLRRAHSVKRKKRRRRS